jgi:hypothetical protein
VDGALADEPVERRGIACEMRLRVGGVAFTSTSTST